MNRSLLSLSWLLFSVAFILSCNGSNRLKQAEAEKTIREFLRDNRTETISEETIQKIDKTNIFSESETSVHVHFKNKETHDLTLRFIFSRHHGKGWFLESIEAVDSVAQELSDWLKAKQNLNIAVRQESP